MKKTAMLLMTVCIIMILSMPAGAQQTISLPPPHTDGGMPLMKALKNRQTNREFSTAKISDQVLSDLLWAACGINRPDVRKRTAPSAMNYQEIDVYIATAEGLFLYDAGKHALLGVSKTDVRASTGSQAFVATAPLDLVFVADYSKMGKSDDKSKENLGMADAAFISENVYLFCASEGLNTGVRAMIDKDVCGKALQLKDNQHIMLGQAIGYPKAK
jgi:nitroreductase